MQKSSYRPFLELLSLNTMNLLSSRHRQFFATLLAGSVCALAYGFLALRSNKGIGIDLFSFLGGYWFVAGVVCVFWLYLHNRQLEISFRAVFVWAVVFRLIGIAGSPILEDDFYRYLLDGCVFLSTGSPYGVTPSSLFLDNNLSPECRSALNWVNNPDLPTIYGPFLQYIFAISHIISPGNIKLLQLTLVIFDLGLIYLLCRLASPKNILLYAWNPLVLKEIAFTAHPDIIGVFFLLAAFVFRYKQQFAIASMMIAVACASKIFAMLLLPYFLYKQKMKYWIIIFGILLLLYLPFVFQGHTNMLVLGIFVEQWQFNASLFYFAKIFTTDHFARYLVLGIFFSWWCYYFFRYQLASTANEIPRVDWIFGVFFLLSPIANPWYIVWLLPFAVIKPSYWAFTVSLAISLSYVTGLNLIESDLGAYQIDNYAFAIEIVAITIAIWFDFREKRFLTTGSQKFLDS